MNTENDNIINAIRECMAENMPARGRAVLFGSQARGMARVDSDWDILVILDKDTLSPSDYDSVTFPLVMLGWDLGKEINPVMYSSKEWERHKATPFYKNVETEGIRLWG